MSDVKRFTHGTTGMLLLDDGEWCRAADCDALAARLAIAERNEHAACTKIDEYEARLAHEQDHSKAVERRLEEYIQYRKEDQARLAEAKALLRALGLDPERFRTECGFLNVPKVVAALKHPADYAGLYLKVPPPYPCIHLECPEPHWCSVEGRCLGPEWKASNERMLEATADKSSE